MKTELFNATLEKILMKASNQVVKERFSAKDVRGKCNGGCGGDCSGRRRFIELELDISHENYSH